MTLWYLWHRYERRQSIALTPRVVTSFIPAEDLEKSPAPALPYIHVTHQQPFVNASSTDLLACVFFERSEAAAERDGCTQNCVSLPFFRKLFAAFLLYSLARRPFVHVSSIDYTAPDLPDYDTAVRNIDGVYSSMNAEVWTQDFPETPPPCYEKAPEMAALVATTNEANAYSSKQAVFTEEMGKTAEIFV
ncbi:uncharacterized protein LOC144630756 [Oculina patagonica]